MTELLAHKDSYLKEFDAQTVATNQQERCIALDRTAFFPGGGGQPSDLGWINDIPVTRVKRQGELIWHWLYGEAPEQGERVHGRLDWDRRYRLMRTHTAFHILCGVVWRDYKAQVTGGNMDVLQGRMDFEFATLQRQLVETIQSKLNEEVLAARPVSVRVLPRTAEPTWPIPERWDRSAYRTTRAKAASTNGFFCLWKNEAGLKSAPGRWPVLTMRPMRPQRLPVIDEVNNPILQ
jgi:misacylated tRNA(Ala) deacylase